METHPYSLSLTVSTRCLSLHPQETALAQAMAQAEATEAAHAALSAQHAAQLQSVEAAHTAAAIQWRAELKDVQRERAAALAAAATELERERAQAGQDGVALRELQVGVLQITRYYKHV